MSVMKKVPEIEKIIGRLNATQLSAVKTAINSTAPETVKSFINPALAFSQLTELSPYDIGTYRVELDPRKIRNGVCIRVLVSDKLYEHLLVYGESQKITIYELNSALHQYKLIEEFCDINELRRILDETQESGGDNWANDAKTHITVNDDGIEVDNCEVSGELEVAEDGSIGTNLVTKIKSALEDSFLRLQSTAPTTPASSGETGDVAFDGTYLYVCVDTDTWKKIAWAEWTVEEAVE